MNDESLTIIIWRLPIILHFNSRQMFHNRIRLMEKLRRKILSHRHLSSCFKASFNFIQPFQLKRIIWLPSTKSRDRKSTKRNWRDWLKNTGTIERLLIWKLSYTSTKKSPSSKPWWRKRVRRKFPLTPRIYSGFLDFEQGYYNFSLFLRCPWLLCDSQPSWDKGPDVITGFHLASQRYAHSSCCVRWRGLA